DAANRPGERSLRLVAPVPPAADAVSLRTWIAVVGAALGAFLANLYLQIGDGGDEGGWITTAYLVAEIIVIPISGWLSRVFSVRLYLLANTLAFLVLTIACAFTTNLGEMI